MVRDQWSVNQHWEETGRNTLTMWGKRSCDRQAEAKSQRGQRGCGNPGLWGPGSKAQQVPPVLGYRGTLLISWACGARSGGGLGRETTWNHLVPSLLTVRGDDMGRWGGWPRDILLDSVYLNLLGGKVQASGSGAGPNISTAWWNELVSQNRSTKRLAQAWALLLIALPGCCSGHRPLTLLYLKSSHHPPPHFPHLQSGAKANYSP